jgi:DNA ligase-1
MLLDVGWVATGLTDEALSDLTELFKGLIVVEKGMELELKPAVIFEVAYEEIQRALTIHRDMHCVFQG